jgi:excisionase family DNA binding protein
MPPDLIPLPTAQPPDPANHGPAAAAEPLLWALEQAAAALNVSDRTLKRMARAGELPAGAVVRFGRRRLFSRLLLEDWCRKGCPPSAKGRRA